MVRNRSERRWIPAVAAAFLLIGSATGPTLAEDQPQPQRGGTPGASTGVGDTPIVGAGTNGNGGVMQAKPGDGKEQKGGQIPAKDRQPQLSK